MKTYLNSTYYIPANQRDYSWENEQIMDFWDDLEAVVNEIETEHFFGQIVIYDDNDKKYIIDGQQRTISSMIFMRALQYVCQQLEKSPEINQQDIGELQSLENDIISSVIGRYATRRISNSLHLMFDRAMDEQDYYVEHIISDAPTKEKVRNKPSLERMRNAYELFHCKLNESLENLSLDDKINKVFKYKDCFLEKFKVMFLETDDLGEAYVIFETLNARGKDLETADLLKNYVFSQARDNQNTVQMNWKELVDAIDGGDTTKYIRYFWNATHDFVRDKALYKTVRDCVRTPLECTELVKNLAKYAKCYQDALTPDSCDYYTDDEIVKKLRALSLLRASSYIPVLLALEMKDYFSDNDKKEILKAIETYVFRNITIMGKTANKTEILFSDLAKKIYSEELRDTQKIISEIKDKTTPDKEFKIVFSEYKTTTKDYIRYIFINIHEHLEPNSEINRDFRKVHIEHIMPKDISQWSGITPEMHEQYLWRLGNIALLDQKLNQRASNKPFKEKCNSYYKNSQIRPNNELTNYHQWTKKEIEERQKQLAKYALEIWNIK